MPIEQVFLTLLAGAACCVVLLWYVRSQRLARSRITIATAAIRQERLEALFVKCLADRGRDPHKVFHDHIACQPQHLGWTISLWIRESHDELGSAITVAATQLDKVHFVPVPREHALWTVVDRWYELAPRMRRFIRAVGAEDPDADISTDLEMFE
jgi:hypothetical protein